MKPIYWIIIAILVIAVAVIVYFVIKKKKAEESAAAENTGSEEYKEDTVTEEGTECVRSMPTDEEVLTLEENTAIQVDPQQSRTTEEYIQWQHEQLNQQEVKTE